MMNSSLKMAVVLFGLGVSLMGRTSSAMDAFEYQVYDSEIDKVGEFSLETHLNNNIAGKKTPDYSGKLNEDHLTHLTFEFARGMTRYWELGSYLQTALGSDGVYRYAGAKLRSKFVVPRNENSTLQLGVNFELSNVPREFEEDRLGSEIRPIIGYTLERWTVTFNPIIDIDLTRGKSASPDFSPALKALFDTKHKFGVGFEYYTDFNDFATMDSFNRAEQYLFAAFDKLEGPYELNLAIGKGLTNASNSWIAKGIFGFTF